MFCSQACANIANFERHAKRKNIYVYLLARFAGLCTIIYINEYARVFILYLYEPSRQLNWKTVDDLYTLMDGQRIYSVTPVDHIRLRHAAAREKTSRDLSLTRQPNRRSSSTLFLSVCVCVCLIFWYSLFCQTHNSITATFRDITSNKLYIIPLGIRLTHHKTRYFRKREIFFLNFGTKGEFFRQLCQRSIKRQICDQRQFTYVLGNDKQRITFITRVFSKPALR